MHTSADTYRILPPALPEVVAPHSSLLGECPVWDAVNQRIYWIDILNGTLMYVEPSTGTFSIQHLGEVTGSFALKRSGGFIMAVRDGFAIMDAGGKKTEQLPAVEAHLPDNRFNDGKCDPAGRFLAGSMSVSGAAGAGALYSVDKDLRVIKRLENISCSNGLAWSADQHTLYHIDTPAAEVRAYDYDVPTGNITNGRPVLSFSPDEGLPDGMCIDEQGMLWIAMWGSGKVWRRDPHTHERLWYLQLPVTQVTSCTFGGENLSDLYVTTAAIGLSHSERQNQPFAGCTFVIRRTGVRGVDPVPFED